MPLNVKNEEAHRYAKKLAELTGKSITEVVTRTLKEAYEKERRSRESLTVIRKDELDAIAVHCASLPVLDSRTPDEILGYNDIGVPE
mgnify:CR=1 FL=1